MAVISVLLVAIFVLTCIFLVALVLIQNSDGGGLGGLLAGNSNSAFGSSSANVLTKVTYVGVALFFVIAFFLALVNKTPSDRGFQQEVQVQRAAPAGESWWNEVADDGTNAVIEEADDIPQDAGTITPTEAIVPLQEIEADIPEEEGEALRDIEAAPAEDDGAALRPD